MAKRERSVLREDSDPEPAAIEAPFVFRKGRVLVFVVSWDYCCRGVKSDYKMVVGRSPDLKGPYVDADGRLLAQGGGTGVLAGNARWPGVGHNSVYSFDGKDYLVFHAYDAGDGGKSKLKIAVLMWNASGWPVVGAGVLED